MTVEATFRDAIPLPQAYTPPFPPRPRDKAAAWRLLLEARRNLLAIWPDFTFERGSFSYGAFGRRIHVVCTPDCVREVFIDKADCVERKTAQQKRALAPLAGDGLIISDGETWRRRRRIVAPTTHASRLPELSVFMSAGAAALAAEWDARGDRHETDLMAEMARLTAGIIGTAVFGSDIDRGDVARLVAGFSDYERTVEQIDLLSLLSRLDRLPRLGLPSSVSAARRIRRALDAIVAAVSPSASTNSLLAALAASDGASLDANALRNEAAVMLLAGHETTANLLAWAFFILSQDPRSERALHDEVDAVLGGDVAEFAHLDRLPFTKAIIQETLRLYPPVPIQARIASKDFTIGAKQVFAGDIVMLNAFILHRHRGVWIDADAFRPERFLRDHGIAPPSRHAYVPFGIGPRVCTGAAFGQTEAILCLASLARRFRVRLREGVSVEPVCRLSLKPGHAVPVIVERRFPR